MTTPDPHTAENCEHPDECAIMCQKCFQFHSDCGCYTPLTPIVGFIQDRARELDPERGSIIIELLATFLQYEQRIDAELGCHHSATQIAVGRCPGTQPHTVHGVRALANMWTEHVDFDADWLLTDASASAVTRD